MCLPDAEPEFSGSDMPLDVLRPMYKDMRSNDRAMIRRRKQHQKYYGYRGVKPSWVGQAVYSLPDSINEPVGTFPCVSYDPLVTHPDQVEVKIWTKRDQYLSSAFDIWPLDRQHKVGRRHRRGCCYVSDRWRYERSSKGKNHLMELEMEQGGWYYESIAEEMGRVLRAAVTDSAWGWIDTIYWDMYTERHEMESYRLHGVDDFFDSLFEQGVNSICAQDEILVDLLEVASDPDFDILSGSDIEDAWEVLSID